MRLRDILLILEREVPHLTPQFSKPAGVTGFHELTNRHDLTIALTRIAQIPSFARAAKRALENPTLLATSTLVDPASENSLSGQLTQIALRAHAVQVFLSAHLPQAPQGYITVHLPSQDNDPANVSKRFNSLFLAFERPVQLVFGTKIQVTLVEPGSMLVELGVTAGAVAIAQVMILIGRLLKFGQEFYHLKQDKAKAEQEVARVKQEQARADQEVAKAKQEQARTDQELLRTKQLANELRRGELELRKTEAELELAKMRAESEAAELTAQLGETRHEVASSILRSMDEVAGLYESQVTFELQSYAEPEIVVNYPIDALPSHNNQSLPDSSVKGYLTE